MTRARGASLAGTHDLNLNGPRAGFPAALACRIMLMVIPSPSLRSWSRALASTSFGAPSCRATSSSGATGKITTGGYNSHPRPIRSSSSSAKGLEGRTTPYPHSERAPYVPYLRPRASCPCARVSFGARTGLRIFPVPDRVYHCQLQGTTDIMSSDSRESRSSSVVSASAISSSLRLYITKKGECAGPANVQARRIWTYRIEPRSYAFLPATTWRPQHNS